LPVIHDPVAIDLFGLSIRWYALFILLGICVAVWVSTLLAKRRGLDPEFLLDIAPWVVFSAIVGARAYYVLLRFREMRTDPSEIINIRLGGLTIHGALIAGTAVFGWFCWRRRQPFLTWADLVIACVPIGQAIGRWGNWANQEAFGTPTTLPWAVHIDPANRPPQYAQFSTFQPTFLYEGLIDLAIAALLIWIVLRAPQLKWYRAGDALAIYCILYGIGRFIIERDRTDSLYIGPLPAAYWLSGALVLFGGTMLALRHLRKPDTVVEASAL
jgi:phosphatidylglycerol:prolipoprotein diacylglycerol transferase